MDIQSRRRLRRKELLQFIMTSFQSLCIAISACYYYFLKIRSIQSFSLLWFLHDSVFVTLTIISFSLWVTARFQLGVHLSFSPKITKFFIQHGIYSKFRHPIYYFGSLSLLFYLILLDRYSWLWCFILLIPFQAIRARREQLFLRNQFGDDYAAYEKSTWI
jgi:protein-S-isoprenylcysteine O-methyltransferase Ste14